MLKKFISLIAVAILLGIFANINASPIAQFDEHGHGDLHHRGRYHHEDEHPLHPGPTHHAADISDSRISSAALASLGG